MNYLDTPPRLRTYDDPPPYPPSAAPPPGVTCTRGHPLRFVEYAGQWRCRFNHPGNTLHWTPIDELMHEAPDTPA